MALYFGWDHPVQTQYDNVLWHPRSLGHWSITPSVVSSFSPDLPENLVLNCNPTIREVAQVIKLIVSSFPAVQYAQLHYRTLESEKIHALKVNVP